jgi:hypothetical protein
MSSVFHYTDTAGLLGVLSSGTLFSTDYRYLNDAAEGAVIRAHIMPIFEAEIGRITPELISRKFLKKDYYEQLGRQASVLEAEGMYRAFVRAIDNISPFFVLSFCKHTEGSQEYNHGLLSQWRGYTGSGGFAIEFDEQALDELARLENTKYAFAGFKSESVEYHDFRKIFDPADYAGIAGDMIWNIFDSVGINVESVTGRKDLDAAVLEFAQTAPFLKHWGFHEEAEYRIVMLCLRPGAVKANEEKRLSKEIKFRQRNGLLIPYIELFGGFDKSLPIKSVIVGPHPLQEEQAEAVRMFIETTKLTIDVRLSEIPYRQ